MLENEDIICISSIDWDFAWQGHQEIMTRLARSGNRVLFIENTGVRRPKISDIGRIRKRIANWKRGVHGIRKIEDRLYVYSPLVLPFPYLKIARFINKKLMFSVLFRWLKAVGFSEPIVWAFLPTGLTIDLIEKLEPKAVVYYCIDFFEASSRDASKIKQTERLLLKRSDVVFATSDELLRHCSTYAKKTYLFPFGVSIENFQRALAPGHRVPEDIKSMKRPIAGYIGGIHKWIDFDLIRSVATRNKDISFVFCGPIQTDVNSFNDLQNISFLGYKETADLPLYVKEFDVAMIPYKITQYTNNVYPTKLNEYLSLGKRVVSTALPEVKRFNKLNGDLVRVASSANEFCESVSMAASEPGDSSEAHRAMDVAKRNSWAVRLEEMSEIVRSVIAQKSREREVSWRKNMGRLFGKARRRILAAAFVLYLLLFYTPFIWLVGEPLRQSSIPERSDVIAVMGGGVGESGRPGQGHEERVDTAIRLLRDGVSGRIIYLSGYKYIMKEADVMKALSVSMGVDESRILVDNKPVNTYEMVRDLSQLLRDNGWGSVVIVSSPYHMLRLKLLCDKYLKGVRIAYVPVRRSSFYTRDSKVRWSQIEGILREYLAILYYKIKGYW